MRQKSMKDGLFILGEDYVFAVGCLLIIFGIILINSFGL